MKNKYKDAVWFKKFIDIEQFSYTDLLILDSKLKQEQKELFLNNEIENPQFTYHLLENFNFEERRQRLSDLSREITKNESNQFIKEAYVRLIDEKLNHLSLLEMSKLGDDEGFAEISSKEFGDFRESSLMRLIPYVISSVDRAEKSGIDEVVMSAKKLKEVIKFLPSNSDSLIPEDMRVETEDVGAQEMEERFRRSFEEYGVQDWDIRVDRENVNAFVHVDQKTKTLVIPASRKLSKSHMEALVKHEVGVHIRRRGNAEKTNLQLLTIGLDRYVKGDEGLGKYEEYQVLPSTFLSTVQIYLGIALIRGIDGKKRGFRDMYNFFQDYYRVTEFEKDDFSTEKNNDLTWRRTEKLFRGTTGQNKGICLTKDLLYLEGYLGIVETLKQFPQEQQRLFVGKYDPANEFHRLVLDELGIF